MLPPRVRIHKRARPCAFAGAVFLWIGLGVCPAQRHSFGSSPPTAPRPAVPLPVPGPIAPVSQGLGPLQFVQVNYGVPPPQALSRQLQADEERIRSAALSSVGVPGQYLTHGHIPFPHSLRLDFAALGTTDELDAILTIELDQHIISAILRPEEGGWHRIASITYATAFADPTTNPGTFLHTTRSVVQPERYRAVFHGSTHTPTGDFVESEANLRVLNEHAVITLSYTSEARVCSEAAAHPNRTGCEVTERWMEDDPTDPTHHLILVTATGHLPARDGAELTAHSRIALATHLRTFTCQPFAFSDTTLHFEPSASAATCPSR